MTAPYIIDLDIDVETARQWYFKRDWALVEKYKTWCKENVGANNWNYYGIYRKTPLRIRFKRSEDLLAFKLTHNL